MICVFKIGLLMTFGNKEQTSKLKSPKADLSNPPYALCRNQKLSVDNLVVNYYLKVNMKNVS